MRFDPLPPSYAFNFWYYFKEQHIRNRKLSKNKKKIQCGLMQLCFFIKIITRKEVCSSSYAITKFDTKGWKIQYPVVVSE